MQRCYITAVMVVVEADDRWRCSDRIVKLSTEKTAHEEVKSGSGVQQLENHFPSWSLQEDIYILLFLIRNYSLVSFQLS